MSIVRGIRRILLFQVILCLVLSGLLWLFMGFIAAKSALLAGVVCVLPNVLFARKLFYFRGARSAKNIVNNFYKGEAQKLFVAFLLFSLIFMYIEIEPLVFFVTFIVVQMGVWFAPLLIDN